MPIAYCCRASATILSFQTLAYWFFGSGKWPHAFKSVQLSSNLLMLLLKLLVVWTYTSCFPWYFAWFSECTRSNLWLLLWKLLIGQLPSTPVCMGIQRMVMEFVDKHKWNIHAGKISILDSTLSDMQEHNYSCHNIVSSPTSELSENLSAVIGQLDSNLDKLVHSAYCKLQSA